MTNPMGVFLGFAGTPVRRLFSTITGPPTPAASPLRYLPPIARSARWGDQRSGTSPPPSPRRLGTSPSGGLSRFVSDG